MLGNKEIMAKNIKRYMEINDVNSADVCKALGFKQNTFSNWINAKIYPRIDKIEMMANYFGVSKSDLVEEQPTVIMGGEATTNRILKYAEMLVALSPESRDRVFHYIDFEKERGENES